MMKTRTQFRPLALGLGLMTTLLLLAAGAPDGWVIRDAEAVIGRPITPVSVAGVARRSTRRAIYATSVYAATLPAGCRTVVIDGVALHQCGVTYYQATGGRYVLVRVD